MKKATLLYVRMCLALFLMCSCSVAANTDKPQSYQFFGASGKYAYKNDYFLTLLEAALAHTVEQYGPWQLHQYPTPMNQGRAIENMAESCEFDIQWHMTTAERERQMRAIRIPLYKGLYGYRALMINTDSANQFSAIESAESLKELLAGQGHDWPDTGILKHNGYNVQAVNNYHGLFNLLAQKRIDYFPRSVAEIGDELLLHAEKPLLAESRILLFYPAPIYFFVCKQHEVLAERLEIGLKKIIENGVFETTFTVSKEFQSFMALGGFSGKVVFNLNNPLILEDNLPDSRQLWLTP